MEVKAQLKYLRISPRKVRLVTDLIKGLDVKEAEHQLKFLPKRAAEPVLKLLKSAISNATNNFNLDAQDLFVYQIRVDQGPTLLRYMPRARGMANEIRKRSSHITIVLKDKKHKKAGEKVEVKKTKEKEISKPQKEKIIISPKQERKQEIKKEKIKTQVMPRQRIFRRKAI
ncbi:MAG: 50S ribosomal protein L22 [Minisyncoccia bacterium]